MIRCCLWIILLSFAWASAQSFTLGSIGTYSLHSSSYIEYEASRPGEVWRGLAPVESIDLEFDDSSLKIKELKVSLRPEKFNSKNLIRDANARRGVFESGKYPEISFVAKEIIVGDWLFEDAGFAEVRLVGDLNMHGITRQKTLVLRVENLMRSINVTGEFSVQLSDFEMNRPRFLNRVVDDDVLIRIVLRADISSF